MIAVWLVAVFAASAILTGAIRRYALAHQVLDVPNERSSHAVPTPRGGGVAISLTFVATLVLLSAIGDVPWRITIALAGSGLIAAVIGFTDDHRSLTPLVRLIAHFAAAAWGLAWIRGVAHILAPLDAVAGGAIVIGLAALFLVWMLNLYNFMDGIDGIAGIEAVTVCSGAVLIATVSGAPVERWLPAAVLATAVLGFLVWNWPPAKVFLGDAGSGFLGVVLGVMALQSGVASVEQGWTWIILLAAFIADATVTLARRVLRGAMPHVAHRTHAYQHAAPRRAHHAAVTTAVGIINVVWLLPLAFAAAREWLPLWIALTVAYAPLIMLAVWLRAGLEPRSGPASPLDAVPRPSRG